uniref:Ig-like domain-containing protein n=1 Tax=Oryzias latipes TaxID=8090 RepID=A0A3P9KRF5_ORYLA
MKQLLNLWHVSTSLTGLKKPAISQKPFFTQPITSCVVPHGEVARFHARVSSMPKPEISWFHNRQPVFPTKNVVFHFDEVTSTATLIIVDAFSEHAGQYTCRAANNAGESVCSATLTITREEEVLEGEPVELKCKLIACPPPTILWFHNNRAIPKERRRRICTESRIHIHNTSLVIESIKDKDSGSYRVMAINSEGSAESTASLLVSLREEQSANYLGFVRRSVQFSCHFKGDPPLTIYWLKNGQPLDHNPDYDIVSKLSNSKLIVFYPTTDHEGIYECIVSNKHGKSMSSATLEISDKKVSRKAGVVQEITVTKELEQEDENLENVLEEELQAYMDPGKATLQKNQFFFPNSPQHPLCQEKQHSSLLEWQDFQSQLFSGFIMAGRSKVLLCTG